MGKIDLSINKVGLAHNIQKAKENNVIIPTIAQMQNPDLIPEKIKAKLSHTGLWDVDPVNLFRISWHNEAKESGGLFQKVPNYVEIPSKLSGVPCRIVAMSGKWFPTGCHKVGASFGCLAPRLVTGQFDATYHHAVWPSTGNYCRGGAFNSKLLACESVAILPQDMSKERFDWLKSIAGQIIATPGCESNVKEIFDKTWELKQDPTMMIFNQFAEMGNPLWHYNVTGYALADLFEAVKKPGQNFAGACFTSGSAGTMSAGDLLKERYPHLKLAVGEALQCPTILDNGFGGHRIEGIGDKHIPWIHNVKNTDMAIAIDDEDSQRLLRLFKLACLLLLGFLGLFFLGLLRGFGFGLLRSFFCLLGCGGGLCLFLRSRIAVCFLTHIYASGSLCLFSGPSIAGVWLFWNIRLRFSAK